MGVLPYWLKNDEEVKKFRNGYKDDIGKWHTGYTTLDARSEELLSKIYARAARKGRILIPFDWAMTKAPANSLMQQIHNSKERMPTIVPQNIAMDWPNPSLNDNSILDITNYQIAAAEMLATGIHKDFLKEGHLLAGNDPHAAVEYLERPELVC